MDMRVITAAVGALSLVLAARGSAERTKVNEEMLAKVARGEVKEARASWWGFDETDATEALQAAINSRVPRLVVDNVGKPWIVRPITLVSNQEIVFEKGVEVVAKKGEFHGLGDCLFTAANVHDVALIGYGATLRMQRADYDNRQLYKKSEWRHALSIRSSRNIRVYGLTLAESGGDGIYLGTATRWITNKNIHIKDVVCESNYRQGISVITAENLLIENTVMRNTAGTPPQAGIDFEPNHSEERLVNIVMRNCVSENNQGCGYVLYLRALKASSAPVSFRFENCRAVNNAGPSVSVTTGNLAADAVKGRIEFIGCQLEGGGGGGIFIGDKPVIGCALRFVNCALINPAPENKLITPIRIGSRRGAEETIGGIEFADVRIRDPLARQPMSYQDGAGGLELDDIVGTLVIETPKGAQRIGLDKKVLAEWMPVIALKRVPRLSLKGLDLRPLGGRVPPQLCGFKHARLRGKGRFVIYAAAGDTVRFTLTYGQVGRYSGKTIPVVVVGPDGKEVRRAQAKFQQDTTVEFHAPLSGIYRVSADPGANWVSITASSHPVNLNGEEGPIGLIHSAGDYFFWVPAGTKTFAVRVSGTGPGEAIKATLVDPSGHVVGQVDNLIQLHQFDVELAAGTKGGVWTLRISKPTAQSWEDHGIDIRGVPPLLAPSREAVLAAGGG